MVQFRPHRVATGIATRLCSTAIVMCVLETELILTLFTVWLIGFFSFVDYFEGRQDGFEDASSQGKCNA